MPFTPQRRTAPELLDLPADAHDSEEFAESLADIAVVNRYLGNTRAVLRHLARMTRMNQRTIFTLLDIGTGSADIPAAIAGWALNAGVRLDITAVDISQRTIEIARKAGISSSDIKLSVADALLLPFRGKSFDFVICSKTLHHFNAEQAVRCIMETRRVAKLGYLILDLRRSWIAYALIRILTRIFTTNRLTRNDGPLSVLKAFTPRELSALATRAGASRFTISREPFWLMILTGGCG